MRTYISNIILVVACLFGRIAYAQPGNITDTTKQQKDTTVSQLLPIVQKILERLEASDEKKDQEKIGMLQFDTSAPAPVYLNNKDGSRIRTGKVVWIDSVSFFIQDGYILDIQVFAGTNVFTNTRAPISIRGKRFSGAFTDYLFNNRHGQEYIIMQESVFYEPYNSFFPDDTRVLLTRKNNRKTLSKNVGVNTVLDLRFYTDALAAFGDESNGIFQTDIRLKQYTHWSHFSNKGFRILQYIKLNFNAGKFDSRHNFVDSSNALSRSALLQKSKVYAEASVNVFSSWAGKKTLNLWYLDAGGGFGTVNLARPVSKDTSAITVQNLFAELGINLRGSSNIGFDFFARGMLQFSPETDFNDQDKGTSFLRLGGEIFWNPFNEPASRIFGRINYTMGMSTAEKKNSYFQVQIGYSALLSKAIGNAKN